MNENVEKYIHYCKHKNWTIKSIHHYSAEPQKNSCNARKAIPHINLIKYGMYANLCKFMHARDVNIDIIGIKSSE